MTGNKQGNKAQGNELKNKQHDLVNKQTKDVQQQNDQRKSPTKQAPSKSQWTGDL